MASLGAYLEASAIQRKCPHLLMLSDPFDWIHFLLEELVGSTVWWEQILKTITLLLDTSGFLCVSDSDRRVPAELGQELAFTHTHVH